MSSQRGKSEDLDGAWKEALEYFLESFLALCFPEVHAGIDWSRGYQSLDKEFQQIVRAARLRKRLADKLFKVWRNDGTETWLLVHVEVQGQRENAFAERMYVYGYRIYDRYQHQVASLAVLCDEHPDWRPDHFEYNNWGSRVGIWFPIAKLIDFRGNEATLEQSTNPFAAVILAHMRVLDTRRAPETRWQWKLRLIKGLYDRGLAQEQIRQLFRVLDWFMALPPELEQSFRTEFARFEEERGMPYVTSIERLAREAGVAEGLEKGLRKGVAEGLQTAVLELLEQKFKKVPAKQVGQVRSVRDVKRLQAALRAVGEANSIADALSPLRDA